MEINPIQTNLTELRLGDKSGRLILFSYKTPVASWEDGQFYVTDTRWSNTTQRHINKWIKSFGTTRELATIVPQDYFHSLTQGAAA
jgi:hypothetical protein